MASLAQRFGAIVLAAGVSTSVSGQNFGLGDDENSEARSPQKIPVFDSVVCQGSDVWAIFSGSPINLGDPRQLDNFYVYDGKYILWLANKLKDTDFEDNRTVLVAVPVQQAAEEIGYAISDCDPSSSAPVLSVAQ